MLDYSHIFSFLLEEELVVSFVLLFFCDAMSMNSQGEKPPQKMLWFSMLTKYALSQLHAAYAKSNTHFVTHTLGKWKMITIVVHIY